MERCQGRSGGHQAAAGARLAPLNVAFGCDDTTALTAAIVVHLVGTQKMSNDQREANGNLNMGAGFALFVAAADAERTAAIGRQHGIEA